MTKKDNNDLTYRLCRSLAFHLVDTELTLQFSEGPTADIVHAVAEAKSLIEEAGFDLETLYPASERPTAMEVQ